MKNMEIKTLFKFILVMSIFLIIGSTFVFYFEQTITRGITMVCSYGVFILSIMGLKFISKIKNEVNE